jgi:hypothetical protein
MKKKFSNSSERSIAAVFGLTVAAVYFFLNIGFTGPAYLADEIGYLLNAAALSGSEVDGASSYHFGYSLFLIPSFVLFETIDSIWRAVQLTNATLFGLSFFSLCVLSKYLVPGASQPKRLLAVGICSLGPHWLVMSGYAFSSPAFTLFFTLSVWSLIRSDTNPLICLCLHGFFVGFLYWIHPTGLAVAAASLLSLSYLGALKNDWKPVFLAALTTASTILLYRWLQPVFWHWMTPEGISPVLHYSSISVEQISLSFLWSVFVRACGQITYITIGTLGFGLVGCWVVLKMAFDSPFVSYKATGSFLFLSLVGLVSIGALMFSAFGADRTDHWIYGRYSAGALLPVFLLGLLALRTKWLALSALLIPAIFLMLIAVTPGAFPINRIDHGWDINEINTPAFWVVEFPSSYGFAVALMIGAGVSALALLLPSALAKALVCAVFLLGINQAFSWHSAILANWSRPSSIPEIIRHNWPAGTCVALDPAEGSTHRLERMGLYKFHLHDYKIRRMHIYEWAANCDGPFITSDFGAKNYLTDIILARELDTGLLLLSKNNIDILEPALGVFQKDHICTVFEECVVKNAVELNQMSQVGVLNGKALNSDGRRGFLFFGPYSDLPRGRYKVNLDADLLNAEGGVIDVVAGPDTSHKLVQFNLVDLHGGGFEFDLHENATKVEIRVFVAENTKVSFRGYELVGPLPALDIESEIEYPIVISPELHAPNLLRKGWYAIESNHVWSKSHASLQLPTPKDCVFKTCEAKLTFSAFGASRRRPVRVYFSSAEQGWRWSEEFNTTSDKSIGISIPLSGSRENRLNIYIPNPTSPKRLGVSSDERHLGISLERIELVKP